MAKKTFIGEKPNDIQYQVTTLLGTTSLKVTDGDRGKPVKLIGDTQYDLCADGDAIEGFVTALEVHPDSGLTVGTIRTGGYKEAIVPTAGWAVGAFVVAAAQSARGVNNDAAKFPRPKVKVVAEPGPFAWRIVSVMVGAVGSANAVVTLERV